MQTPRAAPRLRPALAMDHPTRRGNYDSGQDYVLEYGDLRFTFNERDFSERVEQAALRLGFVGGRLDSTELEDLVNLTVNGEVQDPASHLGEHVNDCWPEVRGRVLDLAVDGQVDEVLDSGAVEPPADEAQPQRRLLQHTRRSRAR